MTFVVNLPPSQSGSPSLLASIETVKMAHASETPSMLVVFFLCCDAQIILPHSCDSQCWHGITSWLGLMSLFSVQNQWHCELLSTLSPHSHLSLCLCPSTSCPGTYCPHHPAPVVIIVTIDISARPQPHHDYCFSMTFKSSNMVFSFSY